MIYKDQYYAKARLHGTVIRVNGIVVYLQHVRGWVYTCTDLDKKTNSNIDLSKAETDLTPLPLGFVNRRGSASYLSRSPVRKWKQGLSNESLKVVEIPYPDEEEPMRGRSVILSRELVGCIEGIYPSVAKTYRDVVRGGFTSMAFHRRFALSRGKGRSCDLWYKTTLVGSVSEKGVHLKSKYSYLKEMIEEILK